MKPARFVSISVCLFVSSDRNRRALPKKARLFAAFRPSPAAMQSAESHSASAVWTKDWPDVL